MRRSLTLATVVLLGTWIPSAGHAASSPQFTSSTVAAGGIPHSVVVGDWNEDGLPDLAASNRGSSTVTVSLATAPGVFAAPTSHPVAAEPYGITKGDLNGDGHIDLITSGFLSARISVLLGTGTGGFVAYTTSQGNGSSIAVATADFNGDGKLDVASANFGTGTASVYYGDGNGLFTGRADLATGSQSWALAVGDLDADGRPDIVTANEAPSTVSVIRNLGQGLFATAVHYSVASNPRGVSIGYLNPDGFLDLAVQGGGGPTTVLLGDGAGGMGNRSDWGAGNFAFGNAIGDLNLDGVADIAGAQAGTNQVSLLLGLGQGSYQTVPQLLSPSAPRALVISDVNLDSKPDLIVANESSGDLRIFMNQSTAIQPSTTSLAVSADTTTYGESVVLTATVSPDTTSGFVSFLDGAVAIGTKPLVGGQATLIVTGLVHGTHDLKARYLGSAWVNTSVSASVQHYVQLAPSLTTVSATPNPVVQHVSTQVSVTVAGTGPGSGTPAGSIQLRVDGGAPGAAVGLVNGQASTSLSGLSVGTHQVEAIYAPQDTLHHSPSVSTPYSLVVELGDPQIVSVTDVPKDQGKKVFVKWRCRLDQPGLSLITGYRVWRRVPATAVAQLRASSSKAVLRQRAIEDTVETFWEDVALLGAARLVSYGYTATTFDDSTSDGIPYTAFFIQALTANPLVWFDSAIDSGYSKDNLAPNAPLHPVATYAGGSTAMHWNPNGESDLRGYQLYRGSSADFEPSPQNFVTETADTAAVDSPGGPYFYKVGAVDIHGNVGAYSVVLPAGTLSTPGNPNVTFAMSGVQPNPTRGRQFSVRLALPTAERATLEVLDIAGRQVHEEDLSAAGIGEHVVEIRPERPLRAGVYLLRLQQGRNQRTRRMVITD